MKSIICKNCKYASPHYYGLPSAYCEHPNLKRSRQIKLLKLAPKWCPRKNK